MKRQTALFFYIIGFYVVLQFTWWGFHLIQLTHELDLMKQTVSHRITMIVGEGIVFLVILIFGLWRIQVSIKRDHKLVTRQNNFLLSVTHELKTPLATTKLYLQTLLKRDFSKEKRDEMLEKALRENKRLEEIVEAILTATRIESESFKPHKEKINLTALLEELKNSYNHQFEKEWIQTDLDSPIFVHTDLFMLKTIFRNLIENAHKYAAESPRLLIYLKRNDLEIRIGVQDEGPGVPKEQQLEIFKKFVRIENEETRSQKGTGLGLYIAAEFSRILGGKLNYLPTKTKGSTFEIIF